MASGPITSWQIDGETVADFIFLGSKITAYGDCSHEIKRRLLLGRKIMTNLDSIFKSRDITLPTKVRLVRSGQIRSVAQSCPTLCDPMACSLLSSSVHNFPSKNTEWGCHFLLQGTFPTKGSNPYLLHLLHWQVDCLPLSHLGSPIVPYALQ